MKLLVFTTSREIREYSARHDNEILPKLLTIGEFLDRLIVTDKIFIDEELRHYYFYEAAKQVDLAALGIESEFEKFLHQADLIYSFLLEMKQEDVALEELARYDVYAEYERHIRILQELLANYERLLTSRRFVDRLVLQNYSINLDYLAQFHEIEIYLAGYLTKFDRDLLAQISTPLTIHLDVTPFNLSLAKKMFGIEKVGRYRIENMQQVERIGEGPKVDRIEAKGFANRIDQADFIFAKIEEFVRGGIDPQRIAVVLPDPVMREYLEAFDRLGNLNFSMGESFVYSDLYRTLEAYYKGVLLGEQEFMQKLDEETKRLLDKAQSWSELKTAILELANTKEKILIEEDLFRFERLVERLQLPREKLLKMLLFRLEKLSFDDVRGGKVTVMEVLESRGAQFDGVIIPDFNEGMVPKLASEDLFIDSRVRKLAGLPTLSDKEALQKHYYAMLLARAKRAAVCYVRNDEQDASRLLGELDAAIEEENERSYANVLMPEPSQPRFLELDLPIQKPTTISPTKLETLLRCPLRYYLQYEKKIEEPKQTFIGTRIHEAIHKAALAKPKNAKEYGDLIMANLLMGLSRTEQLVAEAKWERKLRFFAAKDFEELRYVVGAEKEEKKNLDGFTLKAKADRIVQRDGKLILIDFKTGKGTLDLEGISRERLQGLFYSYIWNADQVFIYDLFRQERIEVQVADAKEELREILAELPRRTEKCEDLQYCRYCAYRFGCKGLE